MQSKTKENVLDTYEVVVGLEVHAQLSTKSKVFCADPTEYGALPNTQISPLSVGLPGSLPMLNKKVVEYAIKMGIATHCNIREYCTFARKNYFYPDLPKGYQITQSDAPICYDGFISVKSASGQKKKIRIERIHMEEDAGKNIHDQDLYDSMVDLNRAGIPLIEIVSAPDISSIEEAHAYLFEIRKLLRYLDISDGNMEEGSLRCDANISVRKKGTTVLNNRCEVKNLNSFKNVQKAISFEFKRQVERMELGEKIEANTLHFDLVTGQTSPTRSKEMANDYRYFLEPDLTPIRISDGYIADIKQDMPLLPEELLFKFTHEYHLNDYDANQLINTKDTAHYFMELCSHTSNYKSAANWVMGPLRSLLNTHAVVSFEGFSIKPNKIADIIRLIENGETSFTNASSKLLDELYKNPHKDVRKIAEKLNLLIEKTNDETINKKIDEILDRLSHKVEEYHKGKKGLIGLFMGELMKAFKGKLNPADANKLLTERLKKRM